MADNDNGHHELTSPRGVAADMLVIVILLAGAFAAETIKSNIPHGVPLIITVILTVSELTLAVYFLVVLARALGYAFSEVDKVQESVEGTRTWQMSKRSLAALFAVLRDALPSAKDFNRALRFGVRFMAAFAFIGAALLIAVNYDFAAGGNSGPEPHGASPAPADGRRAQNTGSLPDGDHGTTQPAPKRDGLTGESAPSTPDKQPQAASLSESKEGGSGQKSREELESQLEKVERDSALLERQRAELMRSLESDRAKSRPQAKRRFKRRPTTAGRKGSPDRRPESREARPSPDSLSDALRRLEHLENDNTLERAARESMPTQDSEETRTLSYRRLQPKPTLAAAVYDLALAVQSYRLYIVVGVLAAALLTLFASLTVLARRAAEEEA
jgi:hypothetical protein